MRSGKGLQVCGYGFGFGFGLGPGFWSAYIWAEARVFGRTYRKLYHVNDSPSLVGRFTQISIYITYFRDVFLMPIHSSWSNSSLPFKGIYLSEEDV